MHKNISKKHKRILIVIYLIVVYLLRRYKKNEVIIINIKKKIRDNTWNTFITFEVYFQWITAKAIIVNITPKRDIDIIVISILFAAKELKQYKYLIYFLMFFIFLFLIFLNQKLFIILLFIEYFRIIMLFVFPLVGSFSLVSFLLLYSLKSGKVPIAVNKLINKEKMHKNISKKT